VSEGDVGYGPPPGNPLGPARGGGIPFDDLARARRFARDFSGPDGIVTGGDAVDKAKIKLVYRDIPLVTIQNTWSVDQARGALFAHLIGIFDASAQLCDSILGDDRVTACLNSKATALFGREVRCKPAQGVAKGSRAAKECQQAWEDHLPILLGDSASREMQDYSTLMGWSHSQVFWPEKKGLAVGAPVLRPWHSRFEYYDWDLRRYMAITRDGTLPIQPGNGKWVEHAPWGPYRGWVRGAIRPVCEPWMLRHFGFRDMARFGEVHGNPTRKGYVPAVGDPVERAAFETALSHLGADTAMIVPRGVDGQDGTGYDYELVEAKSQAWEVHPAQIDRCDMAIVLALLMVNLTTEVDGGSYAAANAHMDVRAGGTQFDNQAWRNTLYTQLARPFAFLNFGDADLAPWTDWDVIPIDEYAGNAKQWSAVGTGLNQMTQAGMRFTDPDEVREWMGSCFGLKRFPKFTMTEPKVAGAAPGESSPPKEGGPRGLKQAA
jgi:phage gp29-like protein